MSATGDALFPAQDNTAGKSEAELLFEERRKQMSGEPYNDHGMVEGRLRAKQLMKRFNNHPGQPWGPGVTASMAFGPEEKYEILKELFGLESVEKAYQLAIEPPFYCDYGTNITFKGSFYANYNVTILDGNKVTFGERCLLSPMVQIYCASHSIETEERREGWQRAYPVTIGDDCWLGGGVIIVGPCKIGNNITIAAGSVVKPGEYLEDNVVLAGNPARVVKRLKAPPPFTKPALSKIKGEETSEAEKSGALPPGIEHA